MNTTVPAKPSAEILAEAARQHAILSEGTAAIYPEKGVHGKDGLFDKLVTSLMENRPLRIKLGMDPTAPDIHLGHTVALNAMRKFQNLGHKVLPLIGNYTALIGDPSGRNSTRPPLTEEQIMQNAETYKEQIFKIIENDPAKCRLMWNGDWLKELSFADTIKLCAQVSVAQLIAKEDFGNRLANQTPISLHEFLYPLMQGYDSIAMQEREGCDIEFGGTDQTFNCLMGRQLMQARGMEPQIVMTFPLLEGLDGVMKMSKSKANYIGVTENPTDMFGKTMSIPDSLLDRWYSLLTTIPAAERPSHPMEAKKKLAHFITARFHGEAAADEARTAFESRFSKREMPTDMPELKLPLEALTTLTDLVVAANFATSKSEARRLIEQGGVKLNGEQHKDPTAPVKLETPFILQVGKLKLAKITA
ncbi:MAG: tyrosine--tRNA ligase [Blastochloris viridis]|uniref:Tyrosine--tRNA ligase n=1 Tax=Blastochloris viridis TaxID=1079 RepID=A0A6N4RAX9_BLAVI|nr:MAG: tyrosine--tRNA ligase [Blastochloris viridis]